MPDNIVPFGNQQSAQLARHECDCRAVKGLTKLKEWINREYHREAALEGFEPAKNWLWERYPSWKWNTPQPVPAQLVKEQITLLEREELLASASQLLPSLEEIPNDVKTLYAQGLAEGRPTFDLQIGITNSALMKVEGLTLEDYRQFIAQRSKIAAEKGGSVVEGVIWKIDPSLPDETIIECVRAFLKLCRPVPPIYQERGNSATMKQLQVIRKALVVYRLLMRAKLTIPQARDRMADWKLPALYSERKDERWNEALDMAEGLLKNLRKGKFIQAMRNFIMTAQARKLHIVKEI